MFLRININNIAGIDEPIQLDFIAKPRKREKKDTITSIERGISVNKITGIIGGNASGKTSIIRALCAIGTFLAHNSQKTSRELCALTKRLKVPYEFPIEDILPTQNASKKDDMTDISVEMFITKGAKPGYYLYSLSYTLDKTKEIKVIESLEYKKKSKDVYTEIFNIKQTRLESELGYKYAYRENIAEDYKKVDVKLYENFLEKILYYETFYKHYVDFSDTLDPTVYMQPIRYINLLAWLQNDGEMVNKVARLVDKKIDRIITERDKDEDIEKIVVYNCNNEKLEYSDLSLGTRKLLFVMQKALEVTQNDGVFLCDEIEDSLHLDLVKLVLKIFTVPNSKSQLLFTTNNENVMDENILRTDQIYCINRKQNMKIEVNKYSDMHGVRYDTSFKINYRKKSSELCAEQPNNEQINEFISELKNA